jgi:hypothetical protein
MYIKRDEIEFIYRTLQDIYNGNEIQSNVLKIDNVILDVCRRNKANNKRVAEYVAEQRKHNKDFARGKGVKAVKTKEV